MTTQIAKNELYWYEFLLYLDIDWVSDQPFVQPYIAAEGSD